MSFRTPSIRWLRFSLRSLIVLLLFAAVGCAAFHYRLLRAERRTAAVARLKEFSGYVQYENHQSIKSTSTESSRVSEWLTMQLGLDFFHDVDTVCIEGRREFSDDDLASTCQLRNVRSLRLGRTTVTDQGLQPLWKLKELRSFSISSPHISDKGMDHLVQLRQLERLILYDVDLTDAGLASLAALENLEVLDIRNTRVTDQGIAKLRAALPNCDIEM